MLTDWGLASLHHLFVFSLVGVIAAEWALVRPGLSGAGVARLGKLDAAYGVLALLVIAAGVSRVIWGVRGWDYYAGNHSFWAKMASFAIVGALSVPPSIRIGRWRKLQKTHLNFAPPEHEIASMRRYLHAEALFLALVPVFAAAMARGF